MFFKSRKFLIWLISLSSVLVVYLFYVRLNKTPPIIVVGGGAKIEDANDEFAGGEIGKVTDRVRVGPVTVARFMDLNPKTRKLEREWGFEKLLHEENEEWEIEKPFMNIYRHNLKCYITADNGKVLLESNTSRPVAKGATFTGNVSIRILAASKDGVKESHVYFDDIIFDGERSMFSTTRRVEFVSEDAQMVGRGMELVYNEEQNNIESLRIIHLESLRLKTTSNTALFAKTDNAVDEPPAETKTTPKIKSDVKPATEEPESGKKRYRCAFMKNVVINAPEQLILAYDEFAINNIMSSESDGKDEQSQAVEAEFRHGESKVADANDGVATVSSASDRQFVDIVVTCENGIVVAPMDAEEVYDSFVKVSSGADSNTVGEVRKLIETGRRTAFVARNIHYDYQKDSIGDIVTSGESELTFYVNNEVDKMADSAVPVKITAEKQAKFLPALNTAIFEGSCWGKMIIENENFQEKRTISAPKFTVIVSRHKEGKSSGSISGIKHFTASDGIVRLANVKMNREELLGGVELKCSQFDYEPGRQLFLVTGPGVITADNSSVEAPKKHVGRFSLQKPCWAFIQDFKTLEYFLGSNQIIAKAQPYETLRVDYFPVVNGEYGQQVSATANNITAKLVETADGRRELLSLEAKDGVTYEEEARKKKWGWGKAVQFVGSEFLYDAGKGIITAWGDESQPCFLNGALVDGIEYNIETGGVKTAIVGPGVLQ